MLNTLVHLPRRSELARGVANTLSARSRRALGATFLSSSIHKAFHLRGLVRPQPEG